MLKRNLVFVLFSLCLFAGNLSAESLHTLAVMDFQNNTGKESLDYLGTGIPQMLITELSASGNVKVVERQRLQQALKELELEQTGIVGGESAQKVGQMLGAELIIMGSYIQIGTSFRIDAHLVQVETGEIIGEKVMGSSVNDVMRLITEMSAKISSRILVSDAEAGGREIHQTGSLAITSYPEKAKVFLNSASVGNAPVSMQGIKVGGNKITVFMNGYYLSENNPQIRPNQIEVLNVTLKKIDPDKSSTLAISTKPTDALVILDGLPLGNTPLTFDSLVAGEHLIKLVKENHNNWEFKVNLVAGKISVNNVTLSPQGDYGSLVVTSKPSGARVFLNGFLKGATPITASQLAVGDYDLVLRLKDYEDIKLVVPVKTDEVSSISAELEYASEEGKARRKMLTSKLKRLDYLMFGMRGTNWGEFYEPSSVTVDNEGHIYVADWLQHRIQKFDTDGTFITNIGAKRNVFNSIDAGVVEKEKKKFQPGTYYKPEDIAIGPKGEIYICDSLNNQVQKFTKDNEFVLRWGRKETSKVGYYTGRLYEPRGICVDKAGNVYVADYRHHRIQKFKEDGRHMMTLGGKKTENPKLLRYPVDVAVDLKMNIWVVNEGTSQVFKFDKDGNPLLTIGKSKPKSKERKQPGNFNSPNGIAIDLVGNVYVADCKNNRVQIFDNDGKFLGSLGTLKKGSKPQQFKYPMGVAVDIAGNIYVADRKNERIHRFPPSLIKKP